MSFSEISNILLQILSGIKFLHSKSITHGDINPRNILLLNLNKDGTFNSLKTKCVLSDFGITEVIIGESKKTEKFSCSP